MVEWDNKWKSIGVLAEADLSHYNGLIGLYRAKLDGRIVYIGRAIEVNNGGFRKRLSDYRRDSDSGRKHQSGKLMFENAHRLQIDILIIGDDESVVPLIKELEREYISKIKPDWNKFLL